MTKLTNRGKTQNLTQNNAENIMTESLYRQKLPKPFRVFPRFRVSLAT